MAKLTKAQRDLLTAISASGYYAARPSNRVVKALRNEDLVAWDGEAGDGDWWLVITDAGRAALQPKSPHHDR